MTDRNGSPGRLILFSLLVGLLVMACSSPAAPAAPGQSGATPAAPKTAEPPGVARLQGADKDRALKLIEEAKKEGELAWRATLIKDDTARALVKGFQDYWGLPGFKVAYDTDMFTGDFVNKTNAELEAGKLTADMVSTGTWSWTLDAFKKNHFMKFDSPVFKEYEPAIKAGIAEPGYWLADAYTFIPVWNTEVYPQGIKTWEDLLDPKYKGKMSILNLPVSETLAVHFICLKSILGIQYWEGIAKQQPIVASRAEDAVAKAASGELPVAQGTMPSRVYQVGKKGAPLGFVVPEKGVALIPQPWIIMAKAAHPNAAKLWFDYIFSDYGQKIYQQGEALFSGRAGFVPPPDVEKFAPPIDKIKAIPFNWKEFTPEVRKAAGDEAKALLDKYKQ